MAMSLLINQHIKFLYLWSLAIVRFYFLSKPQQLKLSTNYFNEQTYCGWTIVDYVDMIISFEN